VVDVETVAYFRALHDTRLGPINIAKPPVDLWSSTLPAQSARKGALDHSKRTWRHSYSESQKFQLWKL
jgi:hypothetical protein